MFRTQLSTFTFADTTVRYWLDSGTGHVGLELFPKGLNAALVDRREHLRDRPNAPLRQANNVDALVHLQISGDAYSSMFAQGRTMRCSSSINRFRYDGQSVVRFGDRTTVITTLTSLENLRLDHRLSWHDGDLAAEVVTSFHNGSGSAVTLEMLTSFSLGNITPFHEADAPKRLQCHRFRSSWCAEGRPDQQSIEQMHLERTPSAVSLQSERFGQVGTMPVRGWFPFAAIEDTEAGVTWAAQIAWAGSWQMEIFRKDDQVCLSGGLADREFGHWMKTVVPGETLETPMAQLTCAHGGIEDVCDRLTRLQHRAADLQPECEQDLPVLFNEWLTTWGQPSQDRIACLARRLRGAGIEYFVLDAGWYVNETGVHGHGDWLPNLRLFPEGLAATVSHLKEMGMRAGLWFELETCTPGTGIASRTEHLLKRDGNLIEASGRYFLDMANPATVEHLSNRVIGLLEECGFDYIKVDYNETIGIGVDGAESLGEGLRRHVEGIHKFFDLLRERLPNLVIENCASGGHRLEPSMIARSAMSSFSDAHEPLEIPIIAAHTQRLILPRQQQIWACLREGQTEREICYNLSSGFLGRLCLSGDIDRISPVSWIFVRNALDIYRRAAPIIKFGRSALRGNAGESWRHPEGWQSVTRIADDGQSILIVAHRFAASPNALTIELPGPGWQIADQLQSDANTAMLRGNVLTCRMAEEFSGCVVRLQSVR